jgi:hypothetical protein
MLLCHIILPASRSLLSHLNSLNIFLAKGTREVRGIAFISAIAAGNQRRRSITSTTGGASPLKNVNTLSYAFLYAFLFFVLLAFAFLS